MSASRSDTSSKRKRSTPQKFRNRKLFASTSRDSLEPEFSQARGEGALENQLDLSELPVILQNKENMPDKCPNGSMTTPRSRGRPKGSKNKTFPTLPTKVYAVREGKSLGYTSNAEGDVHSETPNSAVTPSRGRGRPKGSTKVKPVNDDVPKKSRGRPKGSKNKKPTKAALLKRLTPGVKLGRGRPQKIRHDEEHNEELTPKRGRGRPKGSPNKVKRLSFTSEALEDDTRGSPKKTNLHHPAVTSLTPKRPRGRPRKKPRFQAVPSHEITFVVHKRGRPRKNIFNSPVLPSLTQKRPRGRPSKRQIVPELPSPDHELKSSESNTEDEEVVDSMEDDKEEDDCQEEGDYLEEEEDDDK